MSVIEDRYRDQKIRLIEIEADINTGVVATVKERLLEYGKILEEMQTPKEEICKIMAERFPMCGHTWLYQISPPEWKRSNQIPHAESSSAEEWFSPIEEWWLLQIRKYRIERKMMRNLRKGLEPLHAHLEDSQLMEDIKKENEDLKVLLDEAETHNDWRQIVTDLQKIELKGYSGSMTVRELSKKFHVLVKMKEITPKRVTAILRE